MKKKDQLLLEEAYQIIYLRKYLVSEGYSQEEIEMIIEDDTSRRGFLSKLFKGAAAIGAGALGANVARGDEADDHIRDFSNKIRGDIKNSQETIAREMEASKAEYKKQTELQDKAYKKFNEVIGSRLKTIPEGKYVMSFILQLLNNITTNGLTNGKTDHEAQLVAIDQFAEMFDKLPGDGIIKLNRFKNNVEAAVKQINLEKSRQSLK